MEAEEVISLLDSYWFGQQIFKKDSEQPSLTLTSSDLKFQEKSSKQRNLSQISRSLIDHLIISKEASLIPDCHSPDSVLCSSKRRSISRSRSSFSSEEQVPRTPQLPDENMIKKKGLSRSLTELEYKELKGFMDLGFIFSEEDKKSNLVDIIPGLQRIGKDEEEEEEQKCSISRPYLSEAWKEDLVGDIQKKGMNPLLMKWRIPSSPGNEIDMKHNLKWWAHTVASTVR